MEDDFTPRGDRYCETEYKRYKPYKQKCTNIGSVMDYYSIEVKLMACF